MRPSATSLVRLPQTTAIMLLAAGSVWGQENAPGLTVAPGFEIAVFADGLPGVNGIDFGPESALYATLTPSGRVVRIDDSDRDGRADSVATVAEGLNRPRGLAWHDGQLWVVDSTRVIRFDSLPAPARTVVDGLPAGAPRSILFDPTGNGFFLSVDSSCDLCLEAEPRRATILHYALDGSGEEIWAAGLRRVPGLAYNPTTRELWATHNGRDGLLGDGIPLEEVNALRRGLDYGWPRCYGNRIPNPEYAARCDATEPPVLLLPAHSRPQGIVFYTGRMFPARYRADAFIALHSRSEHSVPRIGALVRVRMNAGRPLTVERFVQGPISENGTGWRPLQLLVGPDGALYVSDGLGGRIWRVTYREE